MTGSGGFEREARGTGGDAKGRRTKLEKKDNLHKGG